MIRLAVRCRSEDAERVLAELLELAPGGVEEVGPISAREAGGEDAGEWVEYAIYGPPGEVPELPELEATGAGGRIEVSSTEIPDDWADRWRDFHRPVSVAGGRITVRPSWAHGDAEGNRKDAGVSGGEPCRDPVGSGREAEQPTGIDVTIDPGQAFGTGAHATTKLCLELLLELADAGLARGPLADLGTGSGVLAIAAAKLGWNPVRGYDSEQAAIEAAVANARVNGVELEFERINLRVEPAPQAPTIVANLTAPLLAEVAATLARAPLPARMVCSGLLESEIEQVSAAFARIGLRAVGSRSSGEWAAISLAAA